MLRYAVCSDIHRRKDLYQKILDREKNIDGVIIAGDLELDTETVRKMTPVPVYAVAGNCDGWTGSDLPLTIAFTAGSHRIMVTHGHRFSVPWLGELEKEALSRKADIVIFGHTHCHFDTVQKGISYLNPGAVRGCRDSGKRTYMLLNLADNGHIYVLYKAIH
jgi:putative phosphoesterase